MAKIKDLDIIVENRERSGAIKKEGVVVVLVVDKLNKYMKKKNIAAIKYFHKEKLESFPVCFNILLRTIELCMPSPVSLFQGINSRI